MPLEASDYALLHECLLRLYKELEADRHHRAMLEVLNELVQADSVVLNLFEVAMGRYTVVTLPEKLAKPEEVEMVGRLLGQSPFPPYFVATSTRSTRTW